MKEFDSYKIDEVLEHKYYQIPQELFDNPLYNDNLTSDSKILYAFLLDRLTLSKKNNWIENTIQWKNTRRLPIMKIHKKLYRI